jgi:hypothetical protein
MSKSEVYSWRLSPETKAALEVEARRQGESLGALLERITADWLASQRETLTEDSAEQARLHNTAAKAIGRIAGGRADRSSTAKRDLRARLDARRNQRRDRQ